LHPNRGQTAIGRIAIVKRPGRPVRSIPKMKAVVHSRYGPLPKVLQLKDVEVPVPKDDEALLRVRASSVNPADWYLARGRPFVVRLAGSGFLKPRSGRTGADVAGLVTSVGKSVTEFRPGDEVFGIGSGAFAEFMTVPEKGLVSKPSNVSFEEAAAVPLAGLTALQALRTHGEVQPGQKVLIQGASGGVGTFAVQLANSLGAEVTAVCSTSKLDLARSLGADHVIDYTRENFSRSGLQYDLILAVNGYHPVRDYRRALTTNGLCVFIGGSMGQMLSGLLVGRLSSRSGRRRVRTFVMQPNKPDLVFLRGLLEAGKLKPVMDRNFPLSEVVDALGLLKQGHARGKITITV
jgi:NADPH:quinone reductase-like Zn-dependent oxidoreductase